MTTTTDTLAVNGGTPVRTDPFPARQLFTEEEKQAAVALFDESIQGGNAFGYGGPEETAYCEEFAAFHGGGFADAVNSGTAAVYCALRALDLEPFTEVITPPITDPGGMMPVPLINCIPVPADAAPGTYNADAQTIAARITERTSAIIVAHIAGHPADMDAIMELARKHNLPVLEDCAQAHGATYKGKLVGTMGDIAAFSTMSGKHHATAAQGGVVFTKNEDLYKKTRQASDRGKPFGVENATGNVMASLNLNLNDLACTVGRVQLKKLPWIVESRQKIAGIIEEGLAPLKTVSVHTPVEGSKSVYWFMLFKLELDAMTCDKQQFVEALQHEGIPAGMQYWCAPHEQPWYTEKTVFGTSGYPWNSPLYKGDPDQTYDIPNARAARDSFSNMTFHERLTEKEAADIIAAMIKVDAAFAK